MGRSFVLKDTSGHPGGYLMQGMREICCRADAPAQQAVLLFEDGTTAEFELSGGQEARWMCKGRLLCGGFVCADGHLLLATGDEARSAFLRWLTPASASREEREEPPAPAAEQTGAIREARTWPQRRWPPPPCWPTSQYMQGRWQEMG